MFKLVGYGSEITSFKQKIVCLVHLFVGCQLPSLSLIQDGGSTGDHREGTEWGGMGWGESGGALWRNADASIKAQMSDTPQ